ncbi:MAG: acetyl-CoA carboxylase biotin carboxylase subunit [Anaerolineales bacterium]|nr:acetyl-CoA carboxylase biotin carboxylase subunit [Anaerolineales bacterium]
MFSKILIANRGEIAVRILRACREMDIRTVAVYSETDSHALHVQLADEAVCIGPPPARESYLQSEKIIQAAKETGAQAIHPGYGFLSENATFAQAVTDAGLIFIGPPASAIEAMGDKAHARALMQKAGVPVVPGYQGDDQTEVTLTAEAARIGYPILVKAAAGGGGKGMRIAQTPADLPEALAAARREALHAFGDDQLILEKYLAEARHVEIQILADQHGHTLHLNERECSIQRRHQKIIEETPSPLLDEALRAEMGAAAIAAAQAVGYTNAGTIEFIVDPHTRAHYFLEMNTRLQVEHPITEFITGLDLVQWQIKIAAGHSLGPDSPTPLLPHTLSPRGHAIEVRLYAEDPASGFLPASGPLLTFLPPTGPGVRVDTGFQTGDTLTTHYDPLIAKIIVHAEDRPAAIRKMQTALHDTVLLGLMTNLEFLQTVLAHPIFQAGEATTRFIETHLPTWQPDPELPLEVLLAAALTNQPAHQPISQRPNQPYTPWTALPNFRLGQRNP